MIFYRVQCGRIQPHNVISDINQLSTSRPEELEKHLFSIRPSVALQEPANISLVAHGCLS